MHLGRGYRAGHIPAAASSIVFPHPRIFAIAKPHIVRYVGCMADTTGPDTGARQMERYAYHTGFKTLDAAQAALEDAYASGEISPAERPLIQSYDAWVAPKGQPLSTVKRYCITVVA